MNEQHYPSSSLSKNIIGVKPGFTLSSAFLSLEAALILQKYP